jgi:AcrR family transcriptional regulator
VARPASRRAAGQDPHKRRQIIEGAKRCFLKMGFEAASMNDITAEAGVSKGTVYVYFADKEDLFASLCDEERTRHLQFAQTQLEVAPNMEEALRRFGIALATRLTSTEVIRAMRMVLAVAERMPKLAARFFGPEPFSGLTIIKNYLDRKVAEGELEIADTDFAGRQFVDLAMAGLFKRRLFGSMPEEASPETIAAIVDTAVDMFLAYYRKRA